LFDPSQSKNWKALSGYTWSIEYADESSASGTVGTDVVTVGGTSVTGQAVEIATQVSAQFVSDTANNGLLGLAFSSINTGELPRLLPLIQRTDKFSSEASEAENVFRHGKAESELPCFYS
jgi:aspergillopepsin I